VRRALLADNHIATSLDADQLDELKAAVATELSEDNYYLILAAKSVRLQNRVSPILKAVTFLAEPSARELRLAIEYFKLKDGACVLDRPRPLAARPEPAHRTGGAPGLRRPASSARGTGRGSDSSSMHQFFPERDFVLMLEILWLAFPIL
jgi:hypothetical protein